MKIFAQLKSNRDQRGDFMQFYGFSKKENGRDFSEEDSDESTCGEESKQVDVTVVGVVCGQAAIAQQELSDADIEKRALAALRDIFRKRKITVPEVSALPLP